MTGVVLDVRDISEMVAAKIANGGEVDKAHVEAAMEVLTTQLDSVLTYAQSVHECRMGMPMQLKVRAAEIHYGGGATIPLTRGEFVMLWSAGEIEVVPKGKGAIYVYEDLVVERRQNDG